MKTSYLEKSAPASLNTRHTIQPWDSVLVSVYCKKTLIGCGLTHGYNRVLFCSESFHYNGNCWNCSHLVPRITVTCCLDIFLPSQGSHKGSLSITCLFFFSHHWPCFPSCPYQWPITIQKGEIFILVSPRVFCPTATPAWKQTATGPVVLEKSLCGHWVPQFTVCLSFQQLYREYCQ